MCSPRQAHLNALRRFFHTEFVEEISAKYWETQGGGGGHSTWISEALQSRSLKVFLPILVYVKAHWYQYVALSEFV